MADPSPVIGEPSPDRSPIIRRSSANHRLYKRLATPIQEG
ncbi:hypothetical protein GF068_27780 [Polyangium spumosum]|uniref:Uncharacterized protein n=1 Tax=Polyangium spumosum TaxID=889282 RepID=A0A6N7PUG1_9BACT|nr:hypothetical protein [Polyangium spumosum]